MKNEIFIGNPQNASIVKRTKLKIFKSFIFKEFIHIKFNLNKTSAEERCFYAT